MERLTEYELFVNVGLDVHRLGYRQPARRLVIVVELEAAVERGLFRRPRIGELPKVPEVLMSVDDLHNLGCGWWLEVGARWSVSVGMRIQTDHQPQITNHQPLYYCIK